jgi:transglutaminase-like putative cysteine protease
MRIASSIILLLLSTLSAFPNPGVHIGALPDWLVSIHPDLTIQPSTEEISDGYYYELQDEQTNLLRSTEYTHFIKHIINASGVQGQSEVSVTFSPQFQQVVFHRVCILRDGATLDQLQPSRIKIVQEETDAGDFQYNGLQRAFITLTDVRKGDRIEVAYSIAGFNPVFGKKFAAQRYFTRSTAVCNYFRSIISSPDRPLYIITRNNAPAPREQRDRNTLIYRWINPPLKDDDDGDDVPSWFTTLPFVSITEYKDWHEVVDWGLNTFNHYRFPLPPALIRKISEWQKAAAGNKDIFANLAARFVQNDIRYLGLEIGENTHRPHPPADVFTGRFGDCKDKSLLLSVILQHEGIPAYATLINTTEGRNLPNVAPSPRIFDHTIVAIRRTGGGWLYVDPTMSGQRGELTDLYIPDYGYTLVLCDGEDSLRTVPPGKNYNYYIREDLDAPFRDTSRFTVTTAYTGGMADKIRSQYEEDSRKDIEDGYVKYYGSWLTGIQRDRPIDYSDDSLKNELTIKESYIVPHLWTTDKKGKRSFDFVVKMIRDYLPDLPEGRSAAPLSLTYPLQVRYSLHLTLPEEWEFNSGPLHIRNNAYQFDFTPEISGKEMTLRYTLTTFADHIDSADIQQYKDDYKEMDDRISFSLYKEASDLAPALDPPPAQPTRTTSMDSRPFRPCWPAIWLSFFYALFASRLFIYLNTRSTETFFAPGSGYPIGGWVLVFGLCIGAGLLLDAWQFFSANYYSHDNWAAWSNAGGTGMQYLYLGQLVIQLNFIGGACAVLYWFLNRRDIFPPMFIWYAAVVLGGRLALTGLFYSIPIPSALTAYRADLPWAAVRSSVYAAIWITYVLRSRQVKSTFLEPFR